MNWFRNHGTKRTLYLLFLGQVVSFTLALMSFTSSLIANLGNFTENPVQISVFFVCFVFFRLLDYIFCLFSSCIHLVLFFIFIIIIIMGFYCRCGCSSYTKLFRLLEFGFGLWGYLAV